MSESNHSKIELSALWKLNREISQQVACLEGKNAFLEQQIKLLTDSIFQLKSEIIELKAQNKTLISPSTVNNNVVDDLKSTLVHEIRKGFERSTISSPTSEPIIFKEVTPSPVANNNVLTANDLMSPDGYDRDNQSCLTDTIKKTYQIRHFSPTSSWK